MKIPYVSHILKRYLLFPSPGHSDISADAVASFIEKSCLVAHAFEHVFRSVEHYEKEKREIIKCSMNFLNRAYRQIHVSEAQFACIPRKTNKARVKAY